MKPDHLVIDEGAVWFASNQDLYKEAFSKVANALEGLGEAARKATTPWVNEEIEKLPGVINYPGARLHCPQCKEHSVTIMNYTIACYMCDWHRDRIGARRPTRPSVTFRGF